MIARPFVSAVILTLTVFLGLARLAAQNTEQPIVSPKAGAKFTAIPNAPNASPLRSRKAIPPRVHRSFWPASLPIAPRPFTGTLPAKL